MHLLNHSDCEGYLTVKQSIKIRDGLNLILENFDDDISADYNFKEKIIQFRDGLIDAINKNEKVIFS